MKIYLTRHGQDKDNANGILNGHRDEPLTSVGISQAKELAGRIKKTKIKFKYVLSSPLQRAFKTAKIIAKLLEIKEPKKLILLIERDFGIMTGKSHSKILEMCSPNVIVADKVNYFLCPKGAETFPQLLKRAKRLLSYVFKNYKNGNVLLVSHGDLGKMIYAAYYNLDWKQVLKMFHFGNSDLILLSKDCKPEKAHIFKTKQYNK